MTARVQAFSMSSLSSLLPKPIYAHDFQSDESDDDQFEDAAAGKAKLTAPAYGKRQKWVPRTATDFGDGGAYPECHVAQFPQGLGKKDITSSAIVPLTVDAEGKVRHDVLLRQGASKDKIIHSTYDALLPADVTKDDEKRRLPSKEQIEAETLKTKAALDMLVNGKVAAAQQTNIAKQSSEPTYIRYTPAQQGPAFNSGAQQRIIRMVEEQKDPMAPPKFKINGKLPRGPPSPPAPVLHSPPRKVTAEEQAQWKIPPSVSNWKNPKGYTIPLDKRMANDGAGLLDVTVNDNFAKLSESLYIAERKSREAIAMREAIQKKAAQIERERHEDGLRQMAQQARAERAGLKIDVEDLEEVAERETIRLERHKERERQSRIAAAAPDKQKKLLKDNDRDVSERVALGLPLQSSTGGAVDSRLYNQSQGISSGFSMDDDAYDAFDKPLRPDKPTSIYRPSNKRDDIGEDEYEKIKSSDRFRPDKGFQGADGKVERTGPVQFEKQSEDEFGLDKFFNETKEGGKKRNADSSAEDNSKRRR